MGHELHRTGQSTKTEPEQLETLKNLQPAISLEVPKQWVLGAPVGFKVGDCVGDSVGDVEGDTEGETVGLVVGLVVGDAVGSFVGEEVGLADGAAVGCNVGSAVGREVGCAVGDIEQALRYSLRQFDMVKNVEVPKGENGASLAASVHNFRHPAGQFARIAGPYAQGDWKYVTGLFVAIHVDRPMFATS